MPYGHIRRAPKGKKAPVVRRPPTDTTHATGTFDGGKIGAQTVDTTQLALLAVTSDVLAADAVVEEKLEDEAVTTAKLAALAVTAAKIASVNPSTLTGTGTVPLAAVSGLTHAQMAAAAGVLADQLAGDIASDKFATSVRRNTKCVVYSGDEPTCTKTEPIPFGGRSVNDGAFVVDTLQEMTKTETDYDTFSPVASEVVRLRVQVHARGSFISPGCRGQAVVQGVTSGNNVALSRWRDAEIAPDGSVEILVDIDEQVSVSSSETYQVFLTIVDRDGAPFSSAATIKGRDASSGIAGSFFEAVGVPND